MKSKILFKTTSEVQNSCVSLQEVAGFSVCCYLVLTGEPSAAEVQTLIGFPQGAELPLQSSLLQLGGAQLRL